MLDLFLFNVTNLLIIVTILPIVGTLLLLFVPASNHSLLKFLALNVSCCVYLSSIFLWVFFNKSIGSFQFVNKLLWIPFLNLNFSLGVDGISLFFILLTTLLIFLCILISWTSVDKNVKEFLIAFLVMEFFSNWCFFYFRFIAILYIFWKCINTNVFDSRYLRFERKKN
jgi:NADH-quinone oxidoreductase subunit M